MPDQDEVDLNESAVNSRKRKHIEVDSENEDNDEFEDEDDMMEDDDIEQEMDDIDDILFKDGDSNVDESDLDDQNTKPDNDDEDMDDLDLQEDDELDEDDFEEMSNDEEEENQFKEDIYGRTVDVKTGKVVEQGTTSGAQKKLEELNRNNQELAEQRFKIGKTLRGALNRLNERTLVTASRSLEELFNTNSHNDVKSIFYESILKATQTIYLLPDRLLIEYAVFIALAHVNISTEICK